MSGSETFNVLVVDDDRAIVDSLAIYLTAEGYNVLKCYDGLSALEAVAENVVHLIIMDIMMPRMDGIRATMRLREKHNIPIIITSAKSEDADKILGLNIGADDYVTKPFNPLELVARVKSQLRRYSVLGSMEKKEGTLRNGALELDSIQKQLSVDGRQVRLTATEYGIVELLMRNAGRVFSIDEIYQRVWNEPSYSPENTVAVHIRRIREKIEINPREPEYLKVVWGIGYKIEKK